MGRVLVVGSLNMDLVIRTERVPKEGETLIGETFERFPGGKGANQAVAAARLGAHVSMIGAVGADPFGDELVAGMRQDGIDVGGVLRLAQTPTGVACILLERSGQNRIIVVAGANYALDPEWITHSRSAFEQADVVLIQLEVPMTVVERAIELASSADVPVILNPAPAQSLSPEVLHQVSVLTPNEVEASQLTGRTVLGLDDAKEAARELLAMGVGSVVVTLGEQGAVVADGVEEDEMTCITAHSVQVVDTVGAGDAFSGAMAARLAGGDSLVTAAHYASAVAALAVTRKGAQPSMPRVTEVDAFLGALDSSDSADSSDAKRDLT